MTIVFWTSLVLIIGFAFVLVAVGIYGSKQPFLINLTAMLIVSNIMAILTDSFYRPTS
jgi:hypothetical protein